MRLLRLCCAGLAATRRLDVDALFDASCGGEEHASDDSTPGLSYAQYAALMVDTVRRIGGGGAVRRADGLPEFQGAQAARQVFWSQVEAYEEDFVAPLGQAALLGQGGEGDDESDDESGQRSSAPPSSVMASPEELERDIFRMAFVSCDSNGDGLIDQDELGVLMVSSTRLLDYVSSHGLPGQQMAAIARPHRAS